MLTKLDFAVHCNLVQSYQDYNIYSNIYCIVLYTFKIDLLLIQPVQNKNFK